MKIVLAPNIVRGPSCSRGEHSQINMYKFLRTLVLGVVLVEGPPTLDTEDDNDDNDEGIPYSVDGENRMQLADEPI